MDSVDGATRSTQALACALSIIGAIACTPVKPVELALPPEPPEFGRRRPEQIEVLSEKPARPFGELAPLEVQCPVKSETSRDPWTLLLTTQQSGGCTYREALAQATVRASKRDADGIFAVRTTAAGNGKITLLFATPFRYAEPAAAESALAGTSSAAVPSPPAPTIEQRLQRLRELREKSVITQEEYEQRRRKILKEM